ncbi:MAG: HAD family hydrolase [Candidatus Omnitrophica bacterium]|nr:HAD family hydrolase [Candidatus Omnitrophota bacterium]
MKAIFIDRDGVINKDPGGWTKHSYVTRWRDFRFLPGVFTALTMLKKRGIKVIVISNQAGVNKGFFTKKSLERITARMIEEIERKGGAIADVYYCIHKREDNCSCRKPKVGLFKKAMKKHGMRCRGAYFIGDSHVDILAGRKMGCKTVFVLSGKTSRKEMELWKERPDHVFKNFLGAVRWILKQKRS